MPKSNFTNRIRTGLDTGNPTTNTLNDVTCVKIVTVTGASKMVTAAFPDNCALIGPPYVVMSSAFSVSAGTRISFGVVGNVTKYGIITGLNAVQATVMPVSAINIRSVGGQFVIAVSAVSGANPTAGGADIYIPFVRTA